jgi:hypothetical protein
MGSVWRIVSLTALLLCLAAKFPGRIDSPVLVAGAELGRHMVYKVGPGSSHCTVNERATLRNWTVSRGITQAASMCDAYLVSVPPYVLSTLRPVVAEGLDTAAGCCPHLRHQICRTGFPLARKGGQKGLFLPSEKLLRFSLFFSVKFMSASMGRVKVFGSVWCSDLNVLPTLKVNSSFFRRHVGRCRCKPAPIRSMYLRVSHHSVRGS